MQEQVKTEPRPRDAEALGSIGRDERLAFAYRTVLARNPSDIERTTLRALLQEHLTEFKAKPEEAKKFLTTGESPRDEELKIGELAAWSMIAHLVLNLSETVTKG